MDQKIISELADIMKQEPKTHAMWIAGSVAEGCNDELSDIDVWIDIDDGNDEAIYGQIETLLCSKGELDLNFDGREAHSTLSHKIYRFAHADPYHYIEVTLQAHSRNFEFTKGVHTIKVLFDKDGTIKTKPLDKIELAKELEVRKKFLTEKIEIGKLSVKKEITRGQFMEAFHNYQFWLVEPVIELARIKYAPLKISYGLKHGSRDLPKETAKEIESLYIITSLEDLRNKIEEVEAMVGRLSL